MRPVISADWWNGHCLTKSVGAAPSGTNLDPNGLMVEQWLTGEEDEQLHLDSGVHFIPLAISLVLVLLLLLLGLRLLPTNLLAASANQLKQAEANGDGKEDVEKQVKMLAVLFVEKLHSNRRMILICHLAEAVVWCSLVGFLVVISVLYGSPLTTPYPDGFTCILFLNAVRGYLMGDKILTHCSLTRSQFYTVAYGCLWLIILVNLLFGLGTVAIRVLLYRKKPMRCRYVKILLDRNELDDGKEAMLSKLVSSLDFADFSMVLQVRASLEKTYLFIDWCAKVAELTK